MRTEDRLRDALDEAGRTVGPATLRTLVAPRRRLITGRTLAVAMTTLLLAGGTAAFLQVRETNEQLRTMTMGFPMLVHEHRPGDPELSVYLCPEESPFPVCQTNGAATSEQKVNIEQALRAMPQVASVTFKDHQTSYDEFIRKEANATLARVVEPSDLPESFWLKMKEDVDWTPTIQAAKGLPGVSNVVNQKCFNDFGPDDPRILRCQTLLYLEDGSFLVS
ncbi:hypothetical protein Acor_16990 [Acrocarpospora corrugata]|uniref:FtsX extracellular domain-containing protein n=1 Tax=Acrocarpospora corrugata TaxID=35763 RepID=A0A5M3VSM1_9ACTN|nr:permease-like cell division protein FtsX [Acrocarpospora corrugata]GER99635.1 hypothetical protein Acor_16990 [Acrocarpospora corrugata]